MESCTNWLGLHAPKGTPDAIVQKLYKAMAETMQSDAVKKGMETLNVYPVVSTPQEFSARIARDSALFAKVAKDANVRAE
jgi:tripartite-type tricarboxylate transporter receptor subunit TctC